MVLCMLSDILGKQIKGVDKTVFYAIKMLVQKFMDCLSEHFIPTNEYQLERTDMLTFEQIARVFAFFIK